jgi:glycosyltransferase involved in cell wall biosynthesis
VKIAFVIPNLLPVGGNSATVLRYLRIASQQKHKIVLFQSYKFHDPNEFPLPDLKKLGIEGPVYLRVQWYKIVEVTRKMPFGFIIHYLTYPFVIFLRQVINRRRILKYGKFDGIYCFDLIDANIFPRRSGMLIVGTHNQKMGDFKAIAINLGFLIHRADGLRLFSNERKFVGQIWNKTCMVIPKGVDTDLFYPRAESINKEIRFLYVARLEPKKGLEILLDAWAHSLGPSCAELHIVGDGRLRGLVEESDVKGLIYHGALYEKPLQEMYRSCDVFIFPTLWDAQPSVVVEAVASGLKVLCSERMRGALDDIEEAGFLKYVGADSKSFASEIDMCCRVENTNFEERKMMHKFMVSNRSLVSEVDNILNFMQRLNANDK